LTLLKKHLILLRSLEEAFSENSVKFSDCRAFSLFKTVPGCRAFRHLVVKNSCWAKLPLYDPWYLSCKDKSEQNKQKQTDVLLYVNDGCGLNNCYSIKCKKQQEEYLCFKGKDMYFRWCRQNLDWTGSDRTGSRIGSLIGLQKVKRKSKTSNRLWVSNK